MAIIVGIDMGGSTTKIAGFDGDKMLMPAQISASNSIASLFGAFGKFLYDNQLEIADIAQVNVTGVGSASVNRPIYGIPTYIVDEFDANGAGGGYFAEGKNEFMVISMGTGTSYVGVKDGIPVHMGGIGIGGGTIVGLSKVMLHTREIDKILELAENGKVSNIDLTIGDISPVPLPGLDLDITASNFGKASSRATCEDIAAGVVHMVLESICQTAALIARNTTIKDFILIGALTNISECKRVCERAKKLFPEYTFIVPEDGEYATAIGCALAKEDKLKAI